MKDDSLKRESSKGVDPGSPLTLKEWRTAMDILTQAATQMNMVFNIVARKISADAGLDPALLGIHPYNAMRALDAGQPWKNVDYNRVRVVESLLEHQFDAFCMVSAFDKAVRLDPHSRWLEANSKSEEGGSSNTEKEGKNIGDTSKSEEVSDKEGQLLPAKAGSLSLALRR